MKWHDCPHDLKYGGKEEQEIKVIFIWYLNNLLSTSVDTSSTSVAHVPTVWKYNPLYGQLGAIHK